MKKNVRLYSSLFAAAALLASGAVYAQDGEALIKKYQCTACHKIDAKSIGPSYQDVAKKYAGNAAAPAQMAERIKKGSKGVWGPAPMTPHPHVPDADIKTMVDYVLSLKK